MKKKICIVFHNADRFNGATRSMLDLIETWVKRNDFNIICVIPRHGSVEEVLSKYKTIKTIVLNYHGVRFYSTERQPERMLRNVAKRVRIIGDYIRLKKKDIKQLRELKIDVVYSNTGAIYYGAWLSSMLKVPHFWHIREMGEEDQNARMLFGKKYFVEQLNKAHSVIAISETVRDKYANYLKNRDNIVRIYNDVSPDNINLTQHSYDGSFKVLIVGSIIEGKGHEQVIRAIKRVKDVGISVELYVAGKANGLFYEQMKKLVDDLGLSNEITFMGHVKDMKTLKEKMNVEIVASKCEAFGRITVEAMLNGLPIIGANTGCTKELIGNNENGLLYVWGNVDDLADKIIYAAKNYDQMIKNSKVAYDFALQFTRGNAALKIADLINGEID